MKTVFVSLLALVAATPALAQSDASLPPKDAEGNDITVTASRSGEGIAVKDLPASVTVLSSEQMEERQTRIVSDILRDVPGVAVNRSIGGLTDIRIRGSEANHVLVLIDGIEASDPYQGQYDFGTLIADDKARIEVLRGQQSSLYGSDAIGGVIQYITPTGTESQGLSARVEGGSFGTAAGAARFGGVAGTLDYALSGTLYRTNGTPTARDGTRDVGYTGVGASAKVNWTPSDIFKLTGVGRYSYTDALSNDTAFSGPKFGYIVDTPGTHFRNKAYYGLLRAALSLADGKWNTALTGQIADTTRTGYSAFGVDYGDKGRRYKGSLESSFQFGSDEFRSKLTGAVDYEREEFQNTVASPFSFSGRKSTENWGFVGQYEGTIADALVLGASIRRDQNDRFADVTTYRLQAGYRLPSGLRAHGAYGTGVKNPGYFELFAYADGRYIGNPNLKPEKSKGWEAGLDQEFAGGKAKIGATYFDSKLEDEIYTTFPAPTFVASPANRTTLSRQKGVEVFASAQPIDQLRFDIAYTYLHARENGTVEVRRPNHIGSFNTTVFSMDKKFSTTLTVRYNGRQDDVAFTDPSFIPVRVSLQEYVLVNLNAEYKLSDRFSVFGRVENLFNERYEEVFSFATPGRGAYGGVKARF
ncbi:TonB-dependent receptor [Sphingomonas sp. Leaf357]|uniref:TonB-dependent receptor plug domain-containing protein n=1 Tax=Sphingomonas sp. Leaf357 TaxID=1736350 RepID=UPI0006FEEC13|nr:TonB-dependent receptor [Sphingomonas sp. Leaf357]KQS04997.1 TonB-dependent receptor [Sphingomonas sp. Leaf357]